MYQTLKALFGHISKHLEVRQKYSTTRQLSSRFLEMLSNTVFRVSFIDIDLLLILFLSVFLMMRIKW